ncbi:hypothetical protein N7492_006376 [Penicillium capsulatum]|uniref:Subtelomeric hrmA-associated cluster protein AFUB-079030/YDR124W-like helical bundle domain-containing protein n=1 Tax=Penicillium capsulatum TaxID=69766 RepID=A0A9W9I1A8_9EURO|nr:hypothetical protein N7492_006376 [Penicillium capsulatum]KAJ6109023.1 hypothetical protein N7512_008860 [Penicillium capsulatum]
MHPIAPLSSPTPCVQHFSITPAFCASPELTEYCDIPWGQATQHFSSTAPPTLALIVLLSGLQLRVSNLSSFGVEAPRPGIRVISSLDNTMDLNRPQAAGEEAELGDYDGSCILNTESSHPDFAMVFIDHDGILQVETSPLLAGFGGAIFTPDVAGRFMEAVISSSQFDQQQPSPYLWNMGPDTGWASATSHTEPVELIPCELQFQQSRQKRRDLKRPRPRPTPNSPAPPRQTILRVSDRKLLRQYYEKAFENFQQLNCRAIAKSYIKLLEPRKQVNFPYNGRKAVSGIMQQVDPEFTKPGWWPAGMIHREPDHLLKSDRIRLLVHILCDLKDTHGVTAGKLRMASFDQRRYITPAIRLQVLDEIYLMRQMEEQFLDGEIDANFLLQMTHTLLPVDVHDVHQAHMPPPSTYGLCLWLFDETKPGNSPAFPPPADPMVSEGPLDGINHILLATSSFP